MECQGTSRAPISMTRAVPWNSMEFHGTSNAPISMTPAVPWNSMEFHGTFNAPISLTRAVPWNSMELQVRQFHWHEQFNGIPGNFKLRQLRWHKQLHGIPWNSMELGVRQFRLHEQFPGISWNSIKFGVRQFRWHQQFHGIPWRTPSSTEFHGNAGVSEIGAPQDPWYTMEFHGTARVSEIGAPQDPWYTMEFHGTARVIEIGTLQVLLNSIELLVPAKLAQFKFHGIPWNCSCQRNWRTWSSMGFHGIASNGSIHQIFAWWALNILYDFFKSPIRHLGIAMRNVLCVWCFSPTLSSLHRCSDVPSHKSHKASDKSGNAPFSNRNVHTQLWGNRFITCRCHYS